MPRATRAAGGRSAAQANATGAERPLGADLALGATRRGSEHATGFLASLPPQTERSFMGQVLAYARLMGWRVWHDQATNTARRCSGCGTVRRTPRNAAGLPDLILVRRPRVVWAELKAERGKTSDDQHAWLDDLRASGQRVYLWRPSDWEEIERVLR